MLDDDARPRTHYRRKLSVSQSVACCTQIYHISILMYINGLVFEKNVIYKSYKITCSIPAEQIYYVMYV